MTFRILINRKALESIRSLSAKSQRIVMEKLKTLQEDPYPGSGSDKERLYVHGREDTYRLHISRTFTAFYRIHEPEKEVHVLSVMSIEQAHKRYGWF
ncbi:type II toxin-antitoxin system RelE/ParE family toxin [Methanoculleus sp.]|uniref:type II toxin-antitoxin system RelE/ParE family toxin n=2 Tax=Methanoculleus sp. TaxID=90427 RepID=UPI001BD4F60D|nr:type II toxin-antitoxin system RelE/ParE family toxin [Methanoculleus sp.]